MVALREAVTCEPVIEGAAGRVPKFVSVRLAVAVYVVDRQILSGATACAGRAVMLKDAALVPCPPEWITYSGTLAHRVKVAANIDAALPVGAHGYGARGCHALSSRHCTASPARDRLLCAAPLQARWARARAGDLRCRPAGVTEALVGASRFVGSAAAKAGLVSVLLLRLTCALCGHGIRLSCCGVSARTMAMNSRSFSCCPAGSSPNGSNVGCVFCTGSFASP